MWLSNFRGFSLLASFMLILPFIYTRHIVIHPEDVNASKNEPFTFFCRTIKDSRAYLQFFYTTNRTTKAFSLRYVTRVNETTIRLDIPNMTSDMNRERFCCTSSKSLSAKSLNENNYECAHVLVGRVPFAAELTGLYFTPHQLLDDQLSGIVYVKFQVDPVNTIYNTCYSVTLVWSNTSVPLRDCEVCNNRDPNIMGFCQRNLRVPVFIKQMKVDIVGSNPIGKTIAAKNVSIDDILKPQTLEKFSIVEQNISLLVLNLPELLINHSETSELKIRYVNHNDSLNQSLQLVNGLREVYLDNELDAETSYEVRVKWKYLDRGFWSDWSHVVNVQTASRVPLRGIHESDLFYEVIADKQGDLMDAVVYFKVPSKKHLGGNPMKYRVGLEHMRTSSVPSLSTNRKLTWRRHSVALNISRRASVSNDYQKEIFEVDCDLSCNLTWIRIENIPKDSSSKFIIDVGTQAGYNDSLKTELLIVSPRNVSLSAYVRNLTSIALSEQQVNVSWQLLSDQRFLLVDLRVVWRKRTFSDLSNSKSIQSVKIDPEKLFAVINLPFGEIARHFDYGLSAHVIQKSIPIHLLAPAFPRWSSLGIKWTNCLYTPSKNPEDIVSLKEISVKASSAQFQLLTDSQCSDQLYGRCGFTYAYIIEWNQLNDSHITSSKQVFVDTSTVTYNFTVPELRPSQSYNLRIYSLSAIGLSEKILSTRNFTTSPPFHSNKWMTWGIVAALLSIVVVLGVGCVIARFCGACRGAEKITMPEPYSEDRISLMYSNGDMNNSSDGSSYTMSVYDIPSNDIGDQSRLLKTLHHGSENLSHHIDILHESNSSIDGLFDPLVNDVHSTHVVPSDVLPHHIRNINTNTTSAVHNVPTGAVVHSAGELSNIEIASINEIASANVLATGAAESITTGTDNNTITATESRSTAVKFAAELTTASVSAATATEPAIIAADTVSIITAAESANVAAESAVDASKPTTSAVDSASTMTFESLSDSRAASTLDQPQMSAVLTYKCSKSYHRESPDTESLLDEDKSYIANVCFNDEDLSGYEKCGFDQGNDELVDSLATARESASTTAEPAIEAAQPYIVATEPATTAATESASTNPESAMVAVESTSATTECVHVAIESSTTADASITSAVELAHEFNITATNPTIVVTGSTTAATGSNVTAVKFNLIAE